ncbi:type IV pilus biogenesis protein PilV [Pusillimonas sp. T7-7]|uniref:shufflon system plasmid conjugative transfer pilus tip adhesin PilV n=1 Tax=Pusillimonas sp. (strain T7-7) TaxID=1007105 RepID=UPI0002084C4E|nr:shufflon system plasmid conjugative transfer pilus tip adhesin PilV [Pusillimonas sp. T7-7]AEC18863.1 type IV pilus biogenesis protein PilV [Pusillimonas sp. T7-7]
MRNISNILTNALDKCGGPRKQKGFGLFEMLAAIAIVTLLYQGLSSVIAEQRATPQINETAAHLEKISIAAAQYVSDNYASLTATLPLNGAARTISQATLRDTGYLSPNIAQNNPYGQRYTLRVRHTTQGSGSNTRNVLEPLVVTEGGRAIPDKHLLRIAGKLKAGGSIRSDQPNTAVGNNGGWQAALSSFGGSPGLGHLAVGMFVSDAGMMSEFLHRSAVPGRPEVNRMNTDINMASNAIRSASSIQTGEAHLTRVVAQATSCSPAGAIARDAAGNPMSCQAGVWTETASLNWVGGQGQRMRMTAANGQTMWMQNLNGKYRWVNSPWTAEIASIDQAGNFRASGSVSTGGSVSASGNVAASGNVTASGDVRGRHLSAMGNVTASGNVSASGNLAASQYITGNRLITREYVQLGGIATEGAACTPFGLVGRNSAGKLLNCESGRWKSSGNSPNAWWASCFGTYNASITPPTYSTHHCVHSGDGDHVCCPK